MIGTSTAGAATRTATMRRRRLRGRAPAASTASPSRAETLLMRLEAPRYPIVRAIANAGAAVKRRALIAIGAATAG